MAQGNGLLAILKHILFRFLDKHDRPFVAPRIEKYGGPQTFKTYAEVEAAFVLPEGDSGKLMAGDLKSGIRDLLNEFLHPLREKINEKVCISLFSMTQCRQLTAITAFSALSLSGRARQPGVPAPGARGDRRERQARRQEGRPRRRAQEGKGRHRYAYVHPHLLGLSKMGPCGWVLTEWRAASSAAVVGPQSLEVKVGRIVDIKKHEQADTLYVEQIDVGEDKPRTIVSGLVNYIPIEKMQNRLVLVCTNLQPAALRGVTSEGMVLAATKRSNPSSSFTQLMMMMMLISNDNGYCHIQGQEGGAGPRPSEPARGRQGGRDRLLRGRYRRAR